MSERDKTEPLSILHEWLELHESRMSRAGIRPESSPYVAIQTEQGWESNMGGLKNG